MRAAEQTYFWRERGRQDTGRVAFSRKEAVRDKGRRAREMEAIAKEGKVRGGK